MVHVDDVAVAMALGYVPVRVPVRLRALPTLMLVSVMLIVHVQMRVLDRAMPIPHRRRPASGRPPGQRHDEELRSAIERLPHLHVDGALHCNNKSSDVNPGAHQPTSDLVVEYH
jgi:hypothetical protein